MWDYKEVATNPGTDGMCTVTYEKETDCSGGYVPTDPETTVPCPCTAADISHSYTACNYLTGKRSLVYYYNRVCEGGEPLPDSVLDIRCDIECGPGNFLPPGTEACASCTPGYFSLGGGQEYTFFEAALPQGFSTSCSVPADSTNTKACSPWALHDGLVVSGDNTEVANVATTLRLYVDILVPGSVSFSYFVDCENWFDGLSFYINDDLTLRKVSHTEEFTTFTADLPVGVHTLRWVYSKDRSIDAGLDQAQISDVQVMGTAFNDDACSACPPGTYQAGSGKSTCVPCPTDHFNTESGQVSCDTCPPDQYATGGAVTCDPRPACTDADYYMYYTACSNGQREQRFSWLLPKICLAGSLPVATTVACAPCNPGEYRVVGSSECQTCPPGTFSAAGASSCTACPAHQQVQRKEYFHETDSWPKHLVQACNGYDCFDGAKWVVNNVGGEWMLDSGNGYGPDIALSFTMEETLYVAGDFKFTYKVACKTYCWNRLRFELDGYIHYVPQYSQSATTHTFYLAHITAGNHTFRWTYLKSPGRDGATDTDRVSIYSIEVGGVAHGGGIQCQACPVGASCDATQLYPTPCAPGTYAQAGAGVCSACEDGTFQDLSGQAECTECGHLTDSSPDDRSRCVAHNVAGDEICGVSMPGPHGRIVVDLSPLAHVDNMYGPIYDNNSQIYYLNVCNKKHSNHTCYDKNGDAIDSFACQQTTNDYALDLGNVMGYFLLEGSREDRPEGVVVSITNGAVGCGGKHRQTNITMRCDPLAGMGLPTVPADTPVEYPSHSCAYNFEWPNAYACRQCYEEDYGFSTSECVDSKQVVQYFWKEPKICFGGSSLPVSREVPCEMVVDNTLHVPIPFIVVTVLIIIAFFVIVGVLVLGVGFLIFKNRQLEHAYQSLSTKDDGKLGGDQLSTFDNDLLVDEDDARDATELYGDVGTSSAHLSSNQARKPDDMKAELLEDDNVDTFEL